VVHPQVANPRSSFLPRGHWFHRTKRIMSNGRSERRIAKTVRVEVCPLNDPVLKEKTITENVSAHGIRVLLQCKLQPLQEAVVTSSMEGIQTPARVVYCQRVGENKFAIGLELSARVDSWSKPY
jgi:hypothetical protein